MVSKYISINELNTFELHDARFVSINQTDNSLLWELELANVTTVNSQNNLSKDMQADKMLLTFNECKIAGITYYGQKSYDRNGRLLSEVPGRTFLTDEYPGVFKTLVKYGGVISKLLRSTDYSKSCSFDILTPFDAITINLEYSQVSAQWNAFEKEAWYIKYKNRS